MALDVTVKNLKPLIRKAQRRRNAILKSGLRSPALDMALSALNDNGFWTPKADISYPELLRYKLILKRFLESDTSTIRGIKNVDKNKRKGFRDFMRTLGYTGNTNQLYDRMGGLDINAMIEQSGFSCDMFFAEMAIAAEDGLLEQFISDMNNPNGNGWRSGEFTDYIEIDDITNINYKGLGDWI